MKHLIHTSYLFLLLCAFLVANCSKEPVKSTYGSNPKKIELSDTSKQKVLFFEKNGVGIEFCLLNEEGQPSTVFYEGENFKFHLAISNNVHPDTSMYIVSYFLWNPRLFMVYSNTNDSIGNPVKWCTMEKCCDTYNELMQGEKWSLEFPWHETLGTQIPFNFNNLIRVFEHFFMGFNQPLLSKGTYYTTFTDQFCLGRYGLDPVPEFVCTDTLQLKINFEIK